MRLRILYTVFLAFALISPSDYLYGGPMNPISPGSGRPASIPRFGEPRVIQTEEGRSIALIADRADPSTASKGVVLYFHGNGEVVEDLAYLLPFFRKVKVHTLFVEYPGYGNAPGKPSEKECFRTALEAYDWAKKEFRNLPIIAAGWSLGSSVAAYLASEREVSHLLMLSPMTSMKEVIKRLMPSVPEILLKENEFDTTRFIGRVKGPVTLIHGTEDDLVPFSMGQRLKGLLGDKARFVPIDGATHNDLFFRGRAEIEAEIQRVVDR